MKYQEKEIVVLCDDPANTDYVIVRFEGDKSNCFAVLKSELSDV